MALIYRSENIQVGTTNKTFAHGLLVAPAGVNGAVFVTLRTSTGFVYVVSSDATNVVLKGNQGALAVDLTVQRFHSIIK